MVAEQRPQPLGADSLTWRYFGDWRTLLFALWAGSMQNMHPVLGAAVAEHSRFFEERWQRLFRSFYPIGGVVYDGPRAAETARAVRGYHETVCGTDSRGNRYHALDPDVFYWAHATFFMIVILMAEHFVGGLSEADKRRAYNESVQWYRLYGVSMRPVPADWDAFCRYWDHMCTDVLEVNQATLDVLDVGDLAKPPLLGWLPDAVWRVLRIPLGRGFRWLTVGLYPQPVRNRLDLSWTRRDQRLFWLVGRVIQHGWKLVPPSRRYQPRARAGWRRAADGIDAPALPLPETPPRNLPPLNRRDDPRHYSPASPTS